MAEEDIYIARTHQGSFKVRDTGIMLYVGGKNHCVSIGIYDTYCNLEWRETDEEWEINGKDIHGEDTVFMTNLAFTILRQRHPHVTVIHVFDDGGFKFPRADGDQLSILKAYLLLYGQTWYEERFGAVTQKEGGYARYVERRERGFDDPAMKPVEFVFRHCPRHAEVEALYAETSTWREFMTRFQETFGSDMYKIMHPWYRQAVSVIMDSALSDYWQIDLATHPTIAYDRIAVEGDSRARMFSMYHPAMYWHTHARPFV